jgi:immune inhibitor A
MQTSSAFVVSCQFPSRLWDVAMKSLVITLLALGLVALCALSSAFAVPPHPDLVARIKNHSATEPYFLQHIDELRARGVESPTRTNDLDQVHHHTLDENINMLVILVDFSDHVSQVAPFRFDTLLFGQQTGTLHNFYNTVSYNRISLVTVNLPSALGWQRAPQTYAYYVNGQNGTGSYPHNSQRLTEDVVQLVDPYVDFSQYDNNGDGYVDALFILHSGRGAEFTGDNDDIWSHAWQTHTPIHVDGVMVSHYSTEPEYWQQLNDMTCGVFAHEMGHAVFGLPDLYDYNYVSAGLGSWSLMAGGVWNGNNGNSPAEPDAWCRIHMGFLDPVNVTANLSQIIIPRIETSPTIYRLWANGAQGNEYFLVENRQRTSYDLHLPGDGLLIYHVDESVSGNNQPWFPGHTNSGHYEVALEQSDGRFDLEQNTNAGDISDPYPEFGSPSFTNRTTPNSQSYAGELTRVTVRNISTSADTMRADLAIRAGVGNLVFLQMPDTTASPNDTLYMPIMTDSVNGQNITSLHLTISCDSTVASTAGPYFDLSGSIIPPQWNATAAHSAGTIALDISGTSPLSGRGLLLSLRFRVLAAPGSGAVSPLTFQRFVFNAGEPEADITTGSISVVSAHILLQPGTIAFGEVQVGSSSSRSLVVRNTGNVSLTVTSISVSPPYSTDFSGTFTVAAGAWTPVQVTFAPAVVGAFPDTLSVTSNADVPIVSVPLSGQGAELSVPDPSRGMPHVFGLSAMYPNPFNPSTTVNYDVPRSARVTISVYDVLGRLIDTPLSAVVEPGHHALTWGCPTCGSGIYLFVMSAEGSRFVQKAMLMK